MIVKCTGYTRGARKASQRANRYLGYISREGTRDGEERAPIWDEEGRRLRKEDIRALKEELKSARGERRLVISPNPTLGMSEGELREMARDILNEYRRATGQRFSYVLSVHTNTDVPHVHVLMYSQRFKDMKMNREDLQKLKEIAKRHEREAWLRRTRLERAQRHVEKLSEKSVKAMGAMFSRVRENWIENAVELGEELVR